MDGHHQQVELNRTTSYVVNPAQSAANRGWLDLDDPDIAQFFTNGAPGPYSLLHLAAADDNAQLGSDRGMDGCGDGVARAMGTMAIGQKPTAWTART
ncbi:MAG: hypothetical protein IPI41_10540 [Flavobacteriales bacterium]|nr:hypothetical protein [Flavobacteriales bacterium]